VRNFRAATTDPLFIVVDGGEWGGGGGETGPDTVAPGSARAWNGAEEKEEEGVRLTSGARSILIGFKIFLF
jgi:hypothetical protein